MRRRRGVEASDPHRARSRRQRVQPRAAVEYRSDLGFGPRGPPCRSLAVGAGHPIHPSANLHRRSVAPPWIARCPSFRRIRGGARRRSSTEQLEQCLPAQRPLRSGLSSTLPKRPEALRGRRGASWSRCCWRAAVTRRRCSYRPSLEPMLGSPMRPPVPPWYPRTTSPWISTARSATGSGWGPRTRRSSASTPSSTASEPIGTCPAILPRPHRRSNTVGPELDLQYRLSSPLHVDLRAGGDFGAGDIAAERADGSEVFRTRPYSGHLVGGLGLHFF
jgi:hypothetical protein